VPVFLFHSIRTSNFVYIFVAANLLIPA